MRYIRRLLAGTRRVPAAMLDTGLTTAGAAARPRVRGPQAVGAAHPVTVCDHDRPIQDVLGLGLTCFCALMMASSQRFVSLPGIRPDRLHRRNRLRHARRERHRGPKCRHVADELPGAEIGVMREDLGADVEAGNVVRFQIGKGNPYQLDLVSQDPHRGPVVVGPGDVVAPDDVVGLADAGRVGQHAQKSRGGIVDVQMLVQRVAVPAEQQRLSPANAVQPAEVPGNLPDQPLLRAIGGRRLENDNWKAFAVVGLQIGRIRRRFVAGVRGHRAQRVVFGRREPVERDAVGTDGGRLDEDPNAAEGADAGGGVRSIKADHVDRGVELLRLHQLLEARPVLPIDLQEPRAVGHGAALTAVDADDLMSLSQGQVDDAGADVAGAADDAYLHGFPPRERGSGTGLRMGRAVCA